MVELACTAPPRALGAPGPLARLAARRLARAVGFAALVVVLTAPRSARAQLHWDVSAQAGAMKRFLAERTAGGDDASLGPAGQLTAHVALLPLVHVGGYFGHDISPLPGKAAPRNVTWGGLRAKVSLPLSGTVRAWAFAGAGYAGVYAQSYRDTFFLATPGSPRTTREGLVHGAGGGFVEVPFGFGASYKLFKPWELCAELGARVGFAHHGSVYEFPGPQLSLPGLPDQNAEPRGLDRFAVGLTVGVMAHL